MKRYQRIDGVWVSPAHRGYKLACGHCGTVMSVDFKIVKGRVKFRASEDPVETRKMKAYIRHEFPNSQRQP